MDTNLCGLVPEAGRVIMVVARLSVTLAGPELARLAGALNQTDGEDDLCEGQRLLGEEGVQVLDGVDLEGSLVSYGWARGKRRMRWVK